MTFSGTLTLNGSFTGPAGLIPEHPVARYYGVYALFLTRNDDATFQDALRNMIAADPMPANRIIAAQALGRCGDPDMAYRTLHKEIAATQNGYVFQWVAVARFEAIYRCSVTFHPR